MKTLATLCIGIVIGAVLAIASMKFIALGCKITRGFSEWSALEVSTDKEVRAKIAECGVKIPREAYDLYFAQEGFQDSSIWIRFTVPRHLIWSVAQNSIAKEEADFSPIFPQYLLKDIWQNKNQNHDLSWWNPNSVSKPLSWSAHKKENHYFEDWLIDSETGTFYITQWDH